MSKQKSLVLWIVSILLMLGIVIFQRMTGPTYPVSGKVEFNTQTYKYEFPRSHGGKRGAEIQMIVKDRNVSGEIKFRRFRSYDEWTTAPMIRAGDTLKYVLRHLPPAGKMIYQVKLVSNGGNSTPVTKEPVIVRYKGEVPALVIILHLFFLFSSFTLSIRAGFEAIYKGEKLFSIALMTCITLFIGGLIIGPLMQEYAFGALWTGWPFGHDLTDNKTAVALIMWLIAMWRIKKNPNAYGWGIAAAIVMLIVFFIPHSLLGSEIDFTKIPK
ncbi:MAG: hypothetical protein EPN82_07555 [Bacteroidetes bacterium]|nr:MAG: hypothetical protein EPN82_07555 [Bacteroidota bacterium]